MKVGILTFHRACNYGAVLQCYALQEVLRSMGHEVHVIDYRQPQIERVYKSFWIRAFGYHIIHIAKLPQYVREVLQRMRIKKYFRTFGKRYLSISDKCNNYADMPCDYDCYVIGSDQLMNISITNGLDMVYAAGFKTNEGAKKIGYAISMNEQSVSKIGREWAKICGRFDAFSVREHRYAAEIQKYTPTQVATCVDPTLLTDAAIWKEMTRRRVVKGKYIVVYQVRPTSPNPNAIMDKAMKLAQDNGWKLIDLSSKKYSVDEWVSLIAHAERVITSSFHATVFALIFERPLNVFMLHDGQDDRYSTLLKSLGVEQYLTELDDSIDETPQVTTNIVSEKLMEIRLSSIDYLCRNMQYGMDKAADYHVITPPPHYLSLVLCRCDDDDTIAVAQSVLLWAILYNQICCYAKLHHE